MCRSAAPSGLHSICYSPNVVVDLAEVARRSDEAVRDARADLVNAVREAARQGLTQAQIAALIGRKFGRHRFGRKTVEGSLGCLLGTCLVAWLTPGLTAAVAFFGAVVATLTEALSFRVDDNITVPIVSGLAMTLLLKTISA